MKTVEASFWISFIISKTVFKNSFPVLLYIYFEHCIHFNILKNKGWALTITRLRQWEFGAVFSKNYVLLFACIEYCSYLEKCE